MSLPMAAWRVSYTPGQWLVLSGPTMLVVMTPPPARLAGKVETLWRGMLHAPSVDALLGLVAEAGLSQVPDLGVFLWNANGLHGLTRGGVRVLDADSGAVALEGSGTITWREESLGTQRRLRVSLGAAAPSDAATRLPLVVGAVGAAELLLSTAPEDQVYFPHDAQRGVLSGVGSLYPSSSQESGGDFPGDSRLPADAATPLADPARTGSVPLYSPQPEDPGAVSPVVGLDAPSASDRSASDEHAVTSPSSDASSGLGVSAGGSQPLVPAPPVPAPPIPQPSLTGTAPPAQSLSSPVESAMPGALGAPGASPLSQPSEPTHVPAWTGTSGQPGSSEMLDADTEGGSISLPDLASASASPVGVASPGRPAPTVIPPRLGEVEDDSGTIFSTGLAATHKPGAAEPVEQQVLAVPCVNSHANAPGTRVCRLCQAPVDGANPRLIRRPILAGVHTNKGDFADVVAGVIVGRAPDLGSGPAGSHLMRVVSPSNDISRNHLLVTTKDWNVVVTDLHSTNGTTVLPAGEAPFTIRDGASVEVEIGTVLDLGDGVSLRIEPPRG